MAVEISYLFGFVAPEKPLKHGYVYADMRHDVPERKKSYYSESYI